MVRSIRHRLNIPQPARLSYRTELLQVTAYQELLYLAHHARGRGIEQDLILLETLSGFPISLVTSQRTGPPFRKRLKNALKKLPIRGNENLPFCTCEQQSQALLPQIRIIVRIKLCLLIVPGLLKPLRQRTRQPVHKGLGFPGLHNQQSIKVLNAVGPTALTQARSHAVKAEVRRFYPPNRLVPGFDFLPGRSALSLQGFQKHLLEPCLIRRPVDFR